MVHFFSGMAGGTVGQVLHSSATTTTAIRRAIQHGQASLRALARRYGINPKTLLSQRWRLRNGVRMAGDGDVGSTSRRQTLRLSDSPLKATALHNGPGRRALFSLLMISRSTSYRRIRLSRLWLWILVIRVVIPFNPGSAAVLQVGAHRQFSQICAALHSANQGDIIEIDPGDYVGDVCSWSTDRLTIRGTTGRARVIFAGQAAENRGLWVIRGADTVIENMEFSGCQVATHNCAGVMLAGLGLTVRYSYFHDNEEGVFAIADPAGYLTIDHCEFARNGFQDGHSHNIYVERLSRFILTNSFSHDAIGGHLVKSRARENIIIYNRLINDDSSSASLELDLPNGGLSYIAHNYFLKGRRERSSTLVSYGSEGLLNGPGHIYFFHNFLESRKPDSIFISTPTQYLDGPLVASNIFVGKGEWINNDDAKMNNNKLVIPITLSIMKLISGSQISSQLDTVVVSANKLFNFELIFEYIVASNRSARDVYRVINPALVETGMLAILTLAMAVLCAALRDDRKWVRGILLIFMRCFSISFLGYILAFYAIGDLFPWLVIFPVIWVLGFRSTGNLEVVGLGPPVFILWWWLIYGWGLLLYFECYSAALLLFAINGILVILARLLRGGSGSSESG
jgi:hypothetical protein